MTSKILVVFTLCMIGFLAPSQASDCEMPALDEEWNHASTVFSGRVTKIESNEDLKTTELQVLRVWKGKPGSEVRLTTKIEQDGCWYPFTDGKVYLVFTSTSDPKSLGCCSRTRIIDDASQDIVQMDQWNESNRKSAAGSRDPFVPVQGDRIQSSNPQVRKTLNVRNAVIVGIMKKGTEYVALIKGADGRVYTMRPGDHLYDGKIYKIEKNSVTFLQGKRKVTKKMHPFPE